MSPLGRPAPRVSDLIAETLGRQLTEGLYRPGERLPPERLLATQLGVSRPTLRAALERLETQGRLRRLQGGGTFVEDNAIDRAGDLLTHEFGGAPEFARDLLEYRTLLEVAAARLAASRATSSDHRRLAARFNAWRTLVSQHDVTTPAETEADLAFHLAVADASHNLALPHFMRTACHLLKDNIADNLHRYENQQRHRALLILEHEAILHAIKAGDAPRAASAARRHLDRVSQAMTESRQHTARLARAHRRETARTTPTPHST